MCLELSCRAWWLIGNSVLCTGNLLRMWSINVLAPHPRKGNWCDGVLISLIVLVIPQYICISKHRVLQPECVQLLFVNCVSIEVGEKKIIGRPWFSRETWDLVPIPKEFFSSYVRPLYSLKVTVCVLPGLVVQKCRESADWLAAPLRWPLEAHPSGCEPWPLHL